MKKPETQHIVYYGSERLIKAVAKLGYINVLNPRTMKYQKFGQDATYEAVHDNDLLWKLISNRDIRTEATTAGYIF